MYSKIVFTTGDVANMLHVHQTTIIDWIDKGILKSYKTPGGHRRVAKEELLRFMTAHNMPIPAGLTTEDKTIIGMEKHRSSHEAFQQGPTLRHR